MATHSEFNKTYAATEALEMYRRVKHTAGSRTAVEYADAGEKSIGVTMNKVAIGGSVTVKQWGPWSTFLMIAAGAITLGADVYGADDGKVDDTASGPKIGEAETAATAANQWVEVRPQPDTAFGVTELYDVNGNETLEITATASAVNHVGLVNAATGNSPRLRAEGESDTGLIFDSADGEEMLILDAVAGAVNELTIRSAATGTNPIIAATGEADSGIEFHNDQAEELLILECVASAVNEITICNAATGNNPTIACTGEADTGITFQNADGEEILILDSVASSVNELTISSAATGNNPAITASGETNVGIDITTKGTGDLNLTAGTGDVVIKCGTVAADKISLQAYDVGTTTYTEMIVIESHATIPQITIGDDAADSKIGFFGATPVAQQAKASFNNWAAATDVAGALAALGLVDAA